MEDLYDNLDNFNDLNILQELKNENQGLKHQLEEKTIAIGKLQNEYDKVTAQFKRLQVNYSSLLKTARAEVERKTQMIASLNIEKDMLVLESLKNGKKERRKFKGGKVHSNKTVSDCGIVTKDHSSIVVEKLKTNDCISGRKVLRNIPSKETNEGTTHLTESDRRTSKIDPCNDIQNNHSAGEYKENHAWQDRAPTELPAFRASSIKNRRKSMPAVSMRDRLSDDELELKPTKTALVKKEFLTVQKQEKRLLETVDNRRFSTKTPDFTSHDIKTNNRESSRESHRKRRKRRYDKDRYRRRNKHDHSEHHKNYSPDKEYRKSTRTHQDDSQRRYRVLVSPPPIPCQTRSRQDQDAHHRSDRDRHRVLISPQPAPSYITSQQNQDDFHHRLDRDRHRALVSPPPVLCQTRSRQYRYNHVRDSDDEMKKPRLEEEYAYKHKIPIDDGPKSKRRKIESYNANERRCVEEKKYDEEEKQHNNMEISEIASPFTPYDLEIEHESCLSPDYAQIDASLAIPIKEIVNTAAIPLEDPRVTSKKYIHKIDADGKTTLCSVTGLKVDILPLNKFQQNNEHVDKSQALMNYPSEFSDQLVREIYNDVDKPIDQPHNTSLEPGEIYDAEDFNPDQDQNNSKQVVKPNSAIDKCSAVLNDVDNTDTALKTCKIPKIKHRIDNTHDTKEKTSLDTNNAKRNRKTNNRTCKKSPIRLTEKHGELAVNKKSRTKEPSKNESHNISALSSRAIVAGDLELSDDLSGNSDNLEVTKNDFQSSEQPNGSEDQINTHAEGIHLGGTSELHALENNCTSLIVPVKINSNEKKISQNVKHIYQNSLKNNSVPASETKAQTKQLGLIKDVADEKIVCQISGLHLLPEINVNTEQIKTVQCDSKRRNISYDKNGEIKNKEKIKETDTKKDKVKRRKSKDKPLSTKKPDGTKTRRDNKPQQIKEKLCDLFGDSSSLITPEDLGIAMYVPMFEDAQDAVDVNINQITSNTSEVENKTQLDSEVTVTKQEDTDLNQSDIDKKTTREVEIKLVPIDENRIGRNEIKLDSKVAVSTPEVAVSTLEANLNESNRDDKSAKEVESNSVPIDVKKIRKDAIKLDSEVALTNQVDVNLNQSNIDDKSAKEAIVENRIGRNKIKLDSEVAVTNQVDANLNQSNIDDKTAREVEIKLVPIDENRKIKNSSCDTEELNTVNTTAVVKTVIISTGLQPPSSEASTRLIPVAPAATINTNQDLAISRKMEIKKEYLKALATSTPYKDISVPKVIETETKTVEELLDKSIDDHKSQIDSQNKLDVPDVRIIVRRRRKVVKRPPVT